MNQLKETMSYMNLRKLADEAGVSYNILKNFSSGRKAHLSDEQFNRVHKAIIRILGGIA